MNKKLLAATLLAAMATVSTANAADTAEVKEREKCYGVAKAAKNDCAAKDGAHSCAGQAVKESDANEWVYVPAGLCDKLAGGMKS